MPRFGRTAPVRILTRVLLPAPLAPIRAWTSPGRTAREALRRAATAPYRLPSAEDSTKRSVHGRARAPIATASRRSSVMGRVATSEEGGPGVGSLGSLGSLGGLGTGMPAA